MRLIRNTGNDRVIDELRQSLLPGSSLDLASPALSLFAFAELRELLEKLDACRVVLPAVTDGDLGLTGTDADRAFRNRLQIRWLARQCARWIQKLVELRSAPSSLPQSILIAGKPGSDLHRVITGNCAFTTEGLVALQWVTVGVVLAIALDGVNKEQGEDLDAVRGQAEFLVQMFLDCATDHLALKG